MKNDIKFQTDLYYCMLRIRRIEEAIADHYSEQRMRTPVHLSIGQELIAAAVGCELFKDDLCVSTHRAHAHYLAKGGSLKSMIAEIYGKVTGCCLGRGGSMHLIDTSVGFMGSTAIVGNTIPIGVGLGLSLKLSGLNRLSCIFLGDGAIEEGVFFESLNIAVLKNLPVLFICENNRYSVYSPFTKRQPGDRKIHEVAKTMGAISVYADGYDFFKTSEVISKAVHAIREGSGPHFIEFETYRWREHCGPNYDNDIGYRTEEEFLSWKKRDPIETFKKHLLGNCILSSTDLDNMEIKIQSEITEAFDFAEISPFPDPLEAITGQYKINESKINMNSAQLNEAVI